MRASSNCCIRRRTIGRVQAYVRWGENPALDSQEAVGDPTQGDVVVKPSPCSSLKVVEPYLPFHLLIVTLDAPS